MKMIFMQHEAWLWEGIFYVRPSDDIHNVFSCFKRQADQQDNWAIMREIVEAQFA